MATGGQRRTRSERVAALELPPGKWERLWSDLHRRDVLARIGLVFLAAALLVMISRSWDRPFSYRVGQVPLHTIDSRVPFEVVDADASRAARDRARWEVRHVYIHDPKPLVRLRETLRNTVLQLIAAPSYAEVDPGVLEPFLPATGKDGTITEEQKRDRFERLRRALAGDENLARFDAAMAAAMAPFETRGLMLQLEQVGEGNQDEIEVILAGHPETSSREKVSSVLFGNGVAVQDALRAELGAVDVADPVFEWIRRQMPAAVTLRPAPEETEHARERAERAVDDVIIRFAPGQRLAEAGKALDLAQMQLLWAEHEAYNFAQPAATRVLRATAVLLLVLGLFALAALYGYHRERQLLVDLRRLSVMLAITIVTVGLARFMGLTENDRVGWRAEIIPLLLFGQVVAIAYHRELALLLSGIAALIVVLALGQGLAGLVVLVGATTVVVLQLDRIRTRSKLIQVGFLGSLAAAALTLGAGVLEYQRLDRGVLIDAARNGLWTLAAGFLMHGLLPYVERLFGVLTDMSLLELSDLSHPLLQELVRRAPSTYNHSIMVGSIAEAAADAIHGRGLLVRVGAYFHDIGKMLKPSYFIENQASASENVHHALVPRMSTLVIVAHIKDGSDLARQHRLPGPIIDFIEQHHGTTLVAYFYGQATQRQANDPNGSEVEESTFRYPGPKPQTKEAAVLMLADAVESACRSLVEPGSSRIESLVREIAEQKLEDGQFDESGLTLRELRTIEDSMIKSLIANYHGRVKYPEQKTA